MKHKHGHLLLLILAILVTIFAAAIYAYMYYMINVHMVKIASLQATIASGPAGKERGQSFIKAYEITAAKWMRLPDFFVPSNKAVNFIVAVEALSAESGGKVSLASIDADNLDSAPKGTVGTIRAHIVAVGPWQTVMRALALAEVLPYKSSINNFQAAVSSDKLNWTLSFDIQAKMMAVGQATSLNQ